MKAIDPRRFAPPPTVHTDLGRDTADRAEGELQVSGTLPPALTGVLYRNGPGRFRRGGRVKRSVLDGDGVIQRLQLVDGRARYARRFVRTPKYLAESAADRFVAPTWSTRAPGFLSNLNPHPLSQAGVTVLMIDGVLRAFDEVAPGFEIDPVTLETRGQVDLGLPDHDLNLKAHARQIAHSGDWLFASTRMGRSGMTIDFVRRRPNGERIATPTIHAPRMAYLHDFAATERFAIVALQPALVRGLRYMAGLTSFVQALQWKPEAGNIVLLVDLATGDVTRCEAPSAWIWHFANAYECGDEVVVDFVGYDDPGHFLGRNAQLSAVMRGRDGVRGAPGTLRRYVIDRRRGRVAQTILSDGNYEFPSVDPHCGGERHGRIYVTSGSAPGILHSGIASCDSETGSIDAFDFGRHVNAGEPVFAAKPGGAPDQGWLITQTLDTQRAASGFAIFDAQHVAEGPIAQADLGEAMPISFHGCWVAQ